MSSTRVLRFLFAGLALGTTACKPSPAPISLTGRWRYSTPADVNYPELLFRDTTALFSSRGDTLYRFRYAIDQTTRTLHLTDWKGQQWQVNILRADADSLIVDHLHEKEGVQRYHRVPDLPGSNGTISKDY